MDQPTTQKRLVILAILFVSVLFILFIFTLLRHRSDAAVEVVTLPPDSTLTVDGKKTKAGTLYLTKTTHILKVSRQFFTPLTRTIDFATYDHSQTLYMMPLPKSPQAIKYLADHPAIEAQREAAGDQQAANAQQQLSKNKLIGLLPYSGPGGTYMVDYGTLTQQDGTQKVTIYIESNTSQDKQAALTWITDQKIDPKTLTIVYEDLQTSPSSSSGSEYQ